MSPSPQNPQHELEALRQETVIETALDSQLTCWYRKTPSEMMKL